jgi:hypothetical protein
MTIQEMGNKGKEWLKYALTGDLFLAMVIVLVGIGAFGLGRLSVKAEKVPVSVYKTTAEASAAGFETGKTDSQKSKPVAVKSETVSAGEGKYVASKNGSAYYLPGCSGASRIKDENKIWFDSTGAAEEAGYHKAANCKGL